MGFTFYVRIVLYVIFFGICFSSLCYVLIICSQIITTGSITFIEPNPFIISIELIWGILGLLILPYILFELIKKKG